MEATNTTTTRKTLALVGLMVLGVLMALTAIAAPESPSELTATAGRHTGLPGVQSVDAYAGNATELNFDHESITKGWQGYYGNITGDIVLDNSDNQTLYAWPLTPSGQIYAAWNASTPTWNSLECLNHANASVEAAIFNTLTSYSDNFTNTFNVTDSHPKFNVSNNHIEQNTCTYSAWTHVSEAYPSTSVFNETVLWDPSLNFTVYTGLISENAVGFDGGDWDFQMLVPEDGWDDNEDALTYYFYIELL